jgi:adenylyltransferase/sulfurtransferase
MAGDRGRPVRRVRGGVQSGRAVEIATGERWDRLLPRRALDEILRQAEEGYPEEICGMVIGRPGEPETYRVRQVANVANREPQADPAGTTRDARTAYKMDPLGQLEALREADREGWEAVLFYHSHPDTGAYFSRMDRDRAVMADGEPLWPGAVYLVVSVMGGRVSEIAAYRWDPSARDFIPPHA